MDFQRELQLHKKLILEWAEAELARILEEDDEDGNLVENLSGYAGKFLYKFIVCSVLITILARKKNRCFLFDHYRGALVVWFAF